MKNETSLTFLAYGVFCAFIAGWCAYAVFYGVPELNWMNAKENSEIIPGLWTIGLSCSALSVFSLVASKQEYK
jgi:H+/Cl- antiporter ClcA